VKEEIPDFLGSGRKKMLNEKRRFNLELL